MNALSKPLGTTASVAFTAICIAVLLAILAICQHYYLGDLPNASDGIRQNGQCPVKSRNEAASYGLPILEPLASEFAPDRSCGQEFASSRHCTESDAKPARFLFEAFLGSFLR